jgi:hypothetical protein
MRRPDDQAGPVDLDEGTEAEPDSRLRAPRALQPPRRLIVVGSLGLIAVLAAAAVAVPLALPHAAQSSATPSLAALASETADATASPSASHTPFVWPTTTAAGPTDTPTPTDTSEPTPQPTPRPTIAARGWPVSWQGGYYGHVSMGPDGSLYILTDEWQGVQPQALDASGHAKPGLKLPNGETAIPIALGTDGSVYGSPCPYSGCGAGTYVFNPDGSLRYQTELEGDILPGPSGTAYVMGNPLTLLTRDGAERPVDGSYTWSAGIVRPDGVLFAQCTPVGVDTGRLCTHDPRTGKVSVPAQSWDPWTITMGSDGTLVAWRTEPGPVIDEEYGETTAGLMLAVLKANGDPAPGWPVSVDRPASAPAVGPDGNVYVSVSGKADQPDQILAFGPDGKALTGWPVTIPAGFRHVRPAPYVDPYWPVSPVPGANGAVHALVSKMKAQSVFAFDASGAIVPGWPADLSQPAREIGYGCQIAACLSIHYPAMEFAPNPSGSGLLYLYLGSNIVALAPNGQVAPGWPRDLTVAPHRDTSAVWWASTPDGGIAVLEAGGNDPVVESDYTYYLTRLAPDGSLAK